MTTRAPRIDAHQHYWSLAHGDYGWLQPTPALHAIYRDFDPRDLHPLLDAAGIDATVLVQAAPSHDETHRLLALASLPAHRVAGVVGWCDLLHAQAPQRIERLAQHERLKGLRPMLQDLPDPRWVLQPALRPALHAMAAHGLVFDALVKGGAQLRALCEFVATQPALTIVLDHAGKPPIASGALEDWAATVGELARAPNARYKLSGLVTEAATHWRVDQLQPWVDVLLERFGPQRLIWGSDWPVLTLAADYAAWVQASDQLLQRLAAPERDAIFGLNAMRCYRLSVPPLR